MFYCFRSATGMLEEDTQIENAECIHREKDTQIENAECITGEIIINFCSE